MSSEYLHDIKKYRLDTKRNKLTKAYKKHPNDKKIYEPLYFLLLIDLIERKN